MSHRIIAGSLFVLSLLAIPIGYFLLHPDLIGLCPKNVAANCLDQNISFGIGEPLFRSIRLLPGLFFIMIFFRKEIFITWLKVIIGVAIIALLLIAISPPTHYFLTPDRTEMTDMMQKVIIIVSIAVILWKYWRLSRVAKAKTTKRG